MYPQRECIEKYQFELRSKYDRECSKFLNGWHIWSAVNMTCRHVTFTWLGVLPRLSLAQRKSNVVAIQRTSYLSNAGREVHPIKKGAITIDTSTYTSCSYSEKVPTNMKIAVWFWRRILSQAKVDMLQMTSRDKLKQQVRGQILSRDVTFMSHGWLRYTTTTKQVNAEIDAVSVWLPVKYCDMLHRVVLHSSGIL